MAKIFRCQFVAVLLLCFGTQTIYAQSNDNERAFGIRYAYANNQKIDHHGLYFIGHLDNRIQLYIGPEISVIRPNYFSNQGNLFEERAIGVGFGLRHKFLEFKPWGRFYGQFHFSGVPVKYYSFPGLGGLKAQRKLKLENTVALGMELDLSSFASFTFGAGLGSNEGFFLILSSFMPHAHVGIELKF